MRRTGDEMKKVKLSPAMTRLLRRADAGNGLAFLGWREVRTANALARRGHGAVVRGDFDFGGVGAVGVAFVRADAGPSGRAVAEVVYRMVRDAPFEVGASGAGDAYLTEIEAAVRKEVEGGDGKRAKPEVARAVHCRGVLAYEVDGDVRIGVPDLWTGRTTYNYICLACKVSGRTTGSRTVCGRRTA